MLTIESAERLYAAAPETQSWMALSSRDQANVPQLGMLGSNAAPHDPEVLIA
jgi:hypothetical protein